MFSRNRIELTGNIAKPAEVRSAGEHSVTRARLLHNEIIPRPDDEPLERLVAVDLEIWGRRGEAFAEFATSRTPVFVEGRLQMDQWEQNGQKRSRLLVRVDRWQFLLPKSSSQSLESNRSTSPRSTQRSRSRTEAVAS